MKRIIFWVGIGWICLMPAGVFAETIYLKTGGSIQGKIVEKTERNAIQQALQRFGGSKTQVGLALGISRKTLWEKMQEYGLE